MVPVYQCNQTGESEGWSHLPCGCKNSGLENLGDVCKGKHNGKKLIRNNLNCSFPSFSTQLGYACCSYEQVLTGVPVVVTWLRSSSKPEVTMLLGGRRLAHNKECRNPALSTEVALTIHQAI